MSYNPITGVITNKRTPNRTPKPNNYGYIVYKLDGKSFKAHRLAFVLMTGDFPRGEVDHINRVRHDNRWLNLRDVTQSENQLNAVVSANNTSGHIGISHIPNGKWKAQFQRIVNGQYRTWSCSYLTLEDAQHGRTAELVRIGASTTSGTEDTD
jgi:hypothetical protein